MARLSGICARFAGILALCLIVPGCKVTSGLDAGGARPASNPTAPIALWYVLPPKRDAVLFRGVVSYDDAGGSTNSMLYPAPNAIGFLAALATHGVILESAKKGQKSKMQEAADRVLLPYQQVLAGMTYRALIGRALTKMSSKDSMNLAGDQPVPSTHWRFDTLPIFSMTQDQSSLLVDNAISVLAPGGAPASSKKYMVRVISFPKDESDLAEFWLRDNGRNLDEVSTQLLAESLDIALTELNSESGSGQAQDKTVRYREGTKEKMERGRVLAEDCRRVLIRNLRGWLMSVPPSVGPAAGAGPCNLDVGPARQG
jgi:hypothetical protein